MENKYYQKIDYELLDKKVAYKGKKNCSRRITL